jgi:hypothetical protein
MVVSRAKFVEATMAKIEGDLEVSHEALLKRLKRLELAAVRSGIEGVGALVLNNCMKLCFYKGPDAATNINSLTKAVAIWGRVRGGENK